MRNPLGGLELYAGLLREALAGQAERLDEVARIEREVGHLKTVVNAAKVRLSGNKWSGKLYRDHSLFPGGLRTQTAEQLVKRHPTDLVKRAVWGMLPKGPLGRDIYKKLKVYAGAEHPHVAQQPQPLKFTERKPLAK